MVHCLFYCMQTTSWSNGLPAIFYAVVQPFLSIKFFCRLDLRNKSNHSSTSIAKDERATCVRPSFVSISPWFAHCPAVLSPPRLIFSVCLWNEATRVWTEHAEPMFYVLALAGASSDFSVCWKHQNDQLRECLARSRPTSEALAISALLLPSLADDRLVSSLVIDPRPRSSTWFFLLLKSVFDFGICWSAI